MKLNINRLIEAFKRLIIFSAFFHLIVVLSYSLLNFNAQKLNYLDILDLDLFFPGISKSLEGQILSLLILVIVYLIFYFIPKSSKTGKGR